MCVCVFFFCFVFFFFFGGGGGVAEKNMEMDVILQSDGQIENLRQKEGQIGRVSGTKFWSVCVWGGGGG